MSTALLATQGPSGLATFWFALIGVLWVGYFFLEGFDFGVGILYPFVTKDDLDRRVLVNAIGPTWDGNEVWLLTAGGAMFAAFPLWYASVFSGFYLALFLILVALIVRGMAFEMRSKRDSVTWRFWWDQCIVFGSALPALLWGVAFANFLHGVPIGAHGMWVGGFFQLVKPYALLGGLTTLSLFTLHGATFLGLKTTGEIRQRSRAAGLRLAIPTFVITFAFLGWTYLDAVHRNHHGLVPPFRLGLHRHRDHHRRPHGDDLPRPVPEGAGLVGRPTLRPHHRQRLLAALHLDGDDDRGADLHPAGPRLPSLELLGLPRSRQSSRRDDAGTGVRGGSHRCTGCLSRRRRSPPARSLRPPDLPWIVVCSARARRFAGRS